MISCLGLVEELLLNLIREAALYEDTLGGYERIGWFRTLLGKALLDMIAVLVHKVLSLLGTGSLGRASSL